MAALEAGALRAAAMCWVVGIAAASGCSMPDAIPLDEQLAKVETRAQPRRLNVAIAPLTVDAELARLPIDPDDDTWSPVVFEPRELRRDLEAAVRRSGAFETHRLRFLDELADAEILPVGDPNAAANPVTAAAGTTGGQADAGPATSSSAARRLFGTPTPVSLDALLDQAYSRGDDLLLTFTARRHAVRFVGNNSWFWPNLLNYFTWVWTAYFVADETYAADLEVDVAMRAVGTGRVLWSKTYAAKPQGELDHFERGWKLFGGLTGLDPENFQEAARKVMPHAINEVAAAIAGDLAGDGWPEDAAAFARGRSKVVGVTVGVDRYARLRDLLVAADNAAKVEQLLLDGQVPRRNLERLGDATKDKATILEAVRLAALRTKSVDTLIVYFSGYAFEAEGSLYLAAHDFDPQRPLESSISLAEIEEALRLVRGREVIILDTSTGGEDRTTEQIRTVRRELFIAAPASAPDQLEASLTAFASAKKHRTVVLGAAPGTGALAVSPLLEDKPELGLFTARLLEAIRAKESDKDSDGVITLAEALAVAEGSTRRLSGQAGLLQVPLTLGAEPADVRLGRVRAEEPAPAAEAPAEGPGDAAAKGADADAEAGAETGTAGGELAPVDEVEEVDLGPVEPLAPANEDAAEGASDR